MAVLADVGDGSSIVVSAQIGRSASILLHRASNPPLYRSRIAILRMRTLKNPIAHVLNARTQRIYGCG